MVTPALFAPLPGRRRRSPRADARRPGGRWCAPTGFYRNKAKSIQACCADLVARHGGEVPRTLEELTALRGVGRKTANVVLGNAFGIPGIVVDTHVARLAKRLGPHARDRSGQDRVRAHADRAARALVGVLPLAHPARTPGVRGAQAALLDLSARSPLSPHRGDRLSSSGPPAQHTEVHPMRVQAPAPHPVRAASRRPRLGAAATPDFPFPIYGNESVAATDGAWGFTVNPAAGGLATRPSCCSPYSALESKRQRLPRRLLARPARASRSRSPTIGARAGCWALAAGPTRSRARHLVHAALRERRLGPGQRLRRGPALAPPSRGSRSAAPPATSSSRASGPAASSASTRWAWGCARSRSEPHAGGQAGLDGHLDRRPADGRARLDVAGAARSGAEIEAGTRACSCAARCRITAASSSGSGSWARGYHGSAACPSTTPACA